MTDTLDLVVRRRIAHGEHTVILDLSTDDGSALPAFEAGAHVDVHLPEGVVRQYSLCGDPADARCYRLGVLRDPASRGGSVAVHQLLQEGARVRVGVPRNHFPLDDSATHSVLLGGGIGITPMLAMAHHLHAAGRSFELHYCVRSMALAGLAAELAAAPYAQRVRLHADDGPADETLDLSAVLAAAKAAGSDRTHVYVCGPAGFMDAMIEIARSAGLPDAQIHREYFNVDVDTSGTGFELVAQRSGKTVRVQEGQTIVAALASIGVTVDVSCEEGVCGTCLCTVIEGECDHRDVYLTDDERAANDQILVCCSRARSPKLVLDV